MKMKHQQQPKNMKDMKIPKMEALDLIDLRWLKSNDEQKLQFRVMIPKDSSGAMQPGAMPEFVWGEWKDVQVVENQSE